MKDMPTEQYIGLDKFLEIIEPQHQKNMKLIKIALKGITEYAVDIKIKDEVDDENVKSLRDFAGAMIEYWLSSSEDNRFIYLDEFDNAINNAHRTSEIHHSERESTLKGLFLYSQDMITSMGVEGKEWIFDCNKLMKKMADHWNIDVTIDANQVSQAMLDIMIEDASTADQLNMTESESEPKWEQTMY